MIGFAAAVTAAVLSSVPSAPVVGLPCEGCEAVFDGVPAQLAATARIAPPGEPGEPLRIEGVVRDAKGAPQPGVIVYAYHTDARGIYPRDERAATPWGARHGRLRAWVKSDAQGRYRFDTIRPAGYPDSTVPQHVHMHVIEPGRATYYLEEMLFTDDPRLTEEQRRQQANGRGGPGLVTPRKVEKTWFVTRDIVLGAAVPGYPASETRPVNPYLPTPYVKLTHPEWTKNATLYQINTRQFTPEGTLKAAEAQLPRLKELGADILWLMPLQPIGVANRKGTLGSPYSIRDYYGVNPEFGTMADVKHFVAAAHAQGFHVILDWVANHTAWDSNLVTEHPEWYERDWKGRFRPTPWWDWSDIINLDYRQEGLRRYMTAAMKHWIVEADLDGFRCDVAGFVPVDFWNNVRRELDAVKPVFMLAEWESRDLHAEAFDATYAWSWNEAVAAIAQGRKKDLSGLFVYYSWNESSFPPDSMRMTFVSNHDKNAWEGTEFEQFGPALDAAIVLSVVGEGMPLVYNGQEAGNPKRLKFFEKDPIAWREHPEGALYRKLFALKKANTALWNAHWGATMIAVPNSLPDRVLSFVRRDERHQVFAALNFSGAAAPVTFKDDLHHGRYVDFASGEPVALDAATRLELPAWGYRVFSR